MGAILGLEKAGARCEAAVFGFGGNQETRNALREPASRLAGCVGFRPENYGPERLRTARHILDGKPTPPAVFVEHVLITPENVDLLYPADCAGNGAGGLSALA